MKNKRHEDREGGRADKKNGGSQRGGGNGTAEWWQQRRTSTPSPPVRGLPELRNSPTRDDPAIIEAGYRIWEGDDDNAHTVSEPD
ncbi:MAG: hypothetical protein Q9165_004226 [Trypethelium subeluteriae]